VPQHAAVGSSSGLEAKGATVRQEDVVEVLNQPLARELLGSAIPARLAYTGLDGFPRVVPIGFYWNRA
jgi:hypothetical protein